MRDRQEKVAPLVRQFQHAAGLEKLSAALREMSQIVSALLAQNSDRIHHPPTIEPPRHPQEPHHRHPRVLLSGIHYKAQPPWIRAFAGITAPRSDV